MRKEGLKKWGGKRGTIEMREGGKLSFHFVLKTEVSPRQSNAVTGRLPHFSIWAANRARAGDYILEKLVEIVVCSQKMPISPNFALQTDKSFVFEYLL